MKTILKQFANEIISKTRNPKNLVFEDFFKDVDTNPEYIVPRDTILYRGRLVKSLDETEINKDDSFRGFDKSGSGITPPHKTSDMRANYKYIPYLYCTPDSYVAVAELRPHLGSVISIARLQVNEELKLFNLASPLTNDTDKNKFLNELGVMFSEPVDSSDSIKDYIPTQYMAEYIRDLGYDGIAYKSSYMNLEASVKKGVSYTDICNFVIFNHSKVVPISSDTFKVLNMDIEVESISNPEEKVLSPIARILGAL